VLWGEATGSTQRAVGTPEGGAATPAGAALCILREMQRRRLAGLLIAVPMQFARRAPVTPLPPVTPLHSFPHCVLVVHLYTTVGSS